MPCPPLEPCTEENGCEPDPTSGKCAGGHRPCPICGGTGLSRVPWDGPRGLGALLAYVGSEGARLRLGWRDGLVGNCTCPCSVNEHEPRGCGTWYGDRNTGFGCNCRAGRQALVFAAWLKGLDCWHDHVLVVAAAAAARAVVSKWASDYWGPFADHACEAAWRYAIEPTWENRKACRGTFPEGLPGFIWHLHCVLVGNGSTRDCIFAIQASAGEIGEDETCKAVCIGLYEWATGGES